jgi:hypothetical protein
LKSSLSYVSSSKCCAGAVCRAISFALLLCTQRPVVEPDFFKMPCRLHPLLWVFNNRNKVLHCWKRIVIMMQKPFPL